MSLFIIRLRFQSEYIVVRAKTNSQFECGLKGPTSPGAEPWAEEGGGNAQLASHTCPASPLPEARNARPRFPQKRHTEPIRRWTWTATTLGLVETASVPPFEIHNPNRSKQKCGNLQVARP